MNRLMRNISALTLAAGTLCASLIPIMSASAEPDVKLLTGTMRKIVVQSVTISINSFAWPEEQIIETGNDGTVVEDIEAVDEDEPVEALVAEVDAATPDTFRLGMRDDAIHALQQRLMQLQFFDGDETTGYYGSVTAEAVKLFQRANDLPIDGVAGPETIDLLYSANAKKYTIKQGDSGTDVAALQRRLKDLRYFSGSATGYFGSSTLSSVKAFQRNNGLTADGKVGLRTRDVLYSSKAKSAPAASNAKTPAPKATAAPKQTAAPSTPSKPAAGVSGFLDFAQAQLGKKYVSGNEGPNSFDCSGYVYYCLKNSGVSIGRLSSKGYSGVGSWQSIKKADIKAGDLLFFGLRGSSGVGHVGIYLGGNKMIHCSSSQGKVIITSITSSYWVENYKSAKRVF
jgi:cell wall-associated NlpC family hydrolase